LKTHGFQISMSRTGNPYDNAVAESFMRTLKCEEVYLTSPHHSRSPQLAAIVSARLWRSCFSLGDIG
jgi:transposase InsO family protein